MKVAHFICLIFCLLFFSGCNVGQQGETRDECIARYLGMAFIAMSATDSPKATANARQQMLELASIAVTLSFTCDEPEGDIFTDIFGI